MQNPNADQVVKILKDSNNVLVTVKNNPSVDELTAAIGLTLILNHMNKHAITVFSGRVPSTLEFLQPEMAIDNTTDSLRDFIIALDKSKADKLRYKVEDNVVRIFITPYKTSISERDLEFSQGDFNVDAVVALGVVTKEDFDQAVTAHGRILHDAVVVALTKHESISQIGAVNWQEAKASSVSEMVASIAPLMGENVMDGQIATALMTGIVAETDRFRNENTTPAVLSISSMLMASGANQQLIAEKLEEAVNIPEVQSHEESYETPVSDDGALEISHDEDEIQNIHIDDNGNLELPKEQELPAVSQEEPLDSPAVMNRSFIQTQQQPALYGLDDSGARAVQPLFEGNNSPGSYASSTTEPALAEHKQMVLQPLPAEEAQEEVVEKIEERPKLEEPATVVEQAVEVPAKDEQKVEEIVATPAQPTQTLSDLEKKVASPHVEENDDKYVDDFLGTSRPAQPVIEKTESEAPKEEKSVEEEKKPEEVHQEPPVATPQTQPLAQPTPTVINPTAPPTVPPPLMPQAPAQPQFFDADGKNSNPFLNPQQ
ncbi:hypothetical protein KBB49_03735 [Candidatus Saccharibacteria bacterium]|nr:hypothetical protein [Candidatus Saccharibacteria bacterium]